MNSLRAALPIALFALGCATAPALAQAPNFFPNPSFELVEPPVPTAALKGRPPPPDQWVPRTWTFWPRPWDCAAYALPDDPAQAHSGRRCVRIVSHGETIRLVYGPIPHFDDQPWQIRFWARGTGELVAVAHEFFHPWTWTRLGEWPFTLTTAWREYAFEFIPPTNCTTWHLDLANRGPTEYWLDDVFVGHPALKPLGLPPSRPTGSDTNTLLYLPFEDPLDEYRFFVKGRVSLSGAGKFGKALTLGPEGYVACSTSGKIKRAQGTIEFWVKLLAPGNDGAQQTFIQIPGPEGMDIHKDIYHHVMFSFHSGFQLISTAWAEGYAHDWQPGVWRHVAACWDREMMQLFIDGKLVGWELRPAFPPTLGPELGIGPASMEIDDLRISDVVRYRVPLHADGPRRNESFAGGKGRY